MKKTILFILINLILFSISNAENIRIHFLYSNDVHGGIDEVPATFMNPEYPPLLGGGASAATYIKQVRENAKQNNEAVLLIDQGDIYTGHPIGTISKGRAIIKFMNMMNYDLMTLGNHEFDIPLDELKETLSLAEFPILSANIIVKDTGELMPPCKPYIIKEVNGVKIAIIGLTTTDTEKMTNPDNVKGLKFLPPADVLPKYIKEVKDKGADLVVVSGHLGIPYDAMASYKRDIVQGHVFDEYRAWGDNAQQLAYKVPGIDIMFAGHIHVGYKKPWEDPNTHTLIFQNYAYGSNIGHVIIEVNKETKTIAGYELPAYIDGSLITLLADEQIPDSDVRAKIKAMQDEAEKGMDEIIGISTMYLTRSGSGAQSPLGNLVLDAMKEEVGADFAFLNLGGIRADIDKGPVTYREIFDVLPFTSQIVTLNISGALLKKIIEVRVSYTHHGLRISGGEVVYNTTLPNFERVTSLKIGGEYWNPNKIYKVATTDFLLQGNASLTLLTRVPEEQIEYNYIVLRDALANYFRKHSPVSASIDNRWKKDDNSKLTPEMEKALEQMDVEKYNNF